MKDDLLLGGMEGGGTKFVCAVGKRTGEILFETRFETTTPDETLGKAIAFFRRHSPEAIGLACFGPLDLDPRSPTYGSITTTPKEHWANIDVIGLFRTELAVPLAFDTDVNTAAYGEFRAIQGELVSSLVYLTIGTGIGAGIIIDGKIVHGLAHPETGHLRLPHEKTRDPFGGTCPFHQDCFEGLASGTAMAARWGTSAEDIPDDHPAWSLEAHYISSALVNVILTLSPEIIILGGGVMSRQHIFPLIQTMTLDLLAGYNPSALIKQQIKEYIVPPRLGKRSGILGAIALADAISRE